jgi:hypothetical protein
MIDIARIIGQSPDAETENTTLIPSASPQALRRVHEEEFDDEETIQDILGADYRNPAPPQKAEFGEVERFGRWANVTIGNTQYCISYITPVAVKRHGQPMVFTSKDWSPTTSNHIAAWTEEIGLTKADGEPYKYREIKHGFQRIPQEEINQMFREDAKKVDWSKKDRNKAFNYPNPMRGYKYVPTEDKIDLPTYRPPEQEI